MTVFVKLMVPILMYASVFWFCTNSQKANACAQLQNAETPIDSVKLVVDDPNQPPYRMFVVAMQKTAKLFKFTLPDGEITINTDTLVQIKPDIKKGNTSTLESISMSFTYGSCNTTNVPSNTATFTDALNWTSVTIGNYAFNQGTTGLQSINPTYIYSWQQKNCCFSFTFVFNTGVAFENEPPPPTFNAKKEEAYMKAFLQTIVFNPK